MSDQFLYPPATAPQTHGIREENIERALVTKLRDLKYTERPDIRDRASLEANFLQKFETLNRVRLTDAEFKRLLEELTLPDVFTAARVLREKNDFTCDDGTPLAYTLVNIKDWCKNDFEVVQQLRINTDYSHHRYDVLLLINGVPVVHIELKTLSVNPRRAMEQIVDYKNDPGNGYPKLMNGVMAKIVIPFPSVAEQQRIASCLSSLDDLIAAQSNQLEALKTKKRAHTAALSISYRGQGMMPKSIIDAIAGQRSATASVD